MYEKVDNKLRYSEEKVVIVGLDELLEKKSQIESILSREAAKYQSELDLYQPQLDEVNTLILEAEKLAIPSEKEEAVKAEIAALEAVEVEAPVEELTIKK